jgi:hypothetical protein
MGFFSNAVSKAKDIEGTIVKDFQKFENLIVSDVKKDFESARADALAANELVNKLKADLQAALTKARDLHQVAVDAATAAAQAADADSAKFKALAAAHAADLATQASQIIAPPAPVVDTPAAQ